LYLNSLGKAAGNYLAQTGNSFARTGESSELISEVQITARRLAVRTRHPEVDGCRSADDQRTILGPVPWSLSRCLPHSVTLLRARRQRLRRAVAADREFRSFPKRLRARRTSSESADRSIVSTSRRGVMTARTGRSPSRMTLAIIAHSPGSIFEFPGMVGGVSA
jgi:hypothetical protein